MAGTIERILSIKFVGNTKDLDKDVSKTRKGIGKLGKVVAGVAVVGIGALTVATIDGIRAFRQEQDIVRAFNRTVKNLGLPVRNATAAMDKMADRAVNLGFDDAETIGGMTKFLQLTGDVGKSSDLMGLAFDIARSRQIPLSAAIKAAQNIYKGSARELKNYGIEGKTGMEAVAAARRKERGQAREWARNHPFEVMLGKVSDTWADLVGNLSQGNFEGAGEAFTKLGRVIERALFGFTTKAGKHVQGLVDKVGAWGGQIATGILDGIKGVDWGKTLSDTLNSALGAVAEGARSGALANIAVIGGAIAGGMFAFHIFFNALHAMLGLPGWAASSLVKVAAFAVGKAFAAAMFVAQLFVDAAGLVFRGAIWAAGAGADVAGRAVGLVFRGAMFVGELIADAFMNALNLLEGLAGETIRSVGAKAGGIFRLAMFTATLMAERLRLVLIALANSTKLGNVATALGRSVGAKVAAGFLGFLTGAWFISQVAQALYNAGGLGKVDEGLNNPANPNQRPLPDWRPGWWPRFAAGTASAPRGWGWVGERGPELVRFRGGEQVLSNRASRDAMGGGSVVNLNVSVNAPIAADGARVGAEIAAYLDRFFSRGGRLRHMPAR
jgi:hypothetical protein